MILKNAPIQEGSEFIAKRFNVKARFG